MPLTLLAFATAPRAEEHEAPSSQAPTPAAELPAEPATTEAPAEPAAPAPAPAVDIPAAPEIRIVIDTSGSMKKNDPKNLRIPALKLIVNLLPDDSQAGVWLFDVAPRELVPVGTADRTWKQAAMAAAAQIGSKGLFTHIEAALATASESWLAAPAASGHRNLILLTDGMVDVSKVAGESASSRERILAEVIPKLQQAGAQINTIALSGQSDQDLMRQLALSTGGWNEVARDASELQRTFLKMFNKAIPHDGVPLQDNQFTVDGSIEEFTVLVMLTPQAKPTKLVAPDKLEMSQAHLPANARWVHEDSFDLVTVTRPSAGKWKLVADVDPLNQVLVVTNLKMEAVPIANFLHSGEQPDIAASFTENGQPVSREDFLGLLTVTAELATGETRQTLPVPRSADKPGLFAGALPAPLEPGEYSVKIVADGKTFQRESTQSFQVMAELVRVETIPDPSTAPPSQIVKLTPDAHALVPASLNIQANLTDAKGEVRPLTATQHEDAWEISLAAQEPGEQWTINFNVTGKAPDGSELAVPLKPLTIGSAQEGEQEHAPEKPAESSSPAHGEPEAKPDWLWTAGIAVGINLAVLLVAWLGHRVFKKRSEAMIARLLGRLSS